MSGGCGCLWGRGIEMELKEQVLCSFSLEQMVVDQRRESSALFRVDYQQMHEFTRRGGQVGWHNTRKFRIYYRAAKET
jgi:hypothetical protein